MRKILNTVILGIICAVLGTLNAAHVSAASNILDARQQNIVAIAALTAKGDLGKLSGVLNQGLQSGLTVNETKEVLVQMYAYCGFPRSLNALNTFMNVIQDRRERGRGLLDIQGRDASPLPADTTLLEIGTANQTKLVGAPVSGAIYSFAPAIDKFLKEHLFADIFGRDILDFQARELATIGALAAMDGVESQLQAHFNMGLNTGLSEQQLQGVIATLKNKVGTAEANRSQAVLNLVLQARNK